MTLFPSDLSSTHERQNSIASTSSIYSLDVTQFSLSTASLPTELNSNFPFPDSTPASPIAASRNHSSTETRPAVINPRHALMRLRRISLPAVVQMNHSSFGIYGSNGQNRMSVASLGSIESLPEEDLEEINLELDGQSSWRLETPTRRQRSDSSSSSNTRSRKPSLLHRATSPAQLVDMAGSTPSSTPRSKWNQRYSNVSASPYHGGYQSFAIPKGTSTLIASRSPLSRPTSIVAGELSDGLREELIGKKPGKQREKSKKSNLFSLEDLEKREDRRWRIALELRDTERVYLDVLEEIDREYYQPLLAALPISPLASKRAPRSSVPTSPIISPISLPSSPIIEPFKRFSSYVPTSPLSSPIDHFNNQIIPRREISEIFSNFGDVLNLAAVISANLDSNVPDRPSEPVAVVASSRLSSGHAPELSSSGETIDSIGPGTPTDDPVHSTPTKTVTETSTPVIKGNFAPPLQLGKSLLPILPFLKSYSFFISNFSTSIARLSALESNGSASNLSSSMEDKFKWSSFVESRRKRGVGQGIGLSGLLLNVVQRVPRYRLLLKDLLKFTEETHSDYKDLREAFQIVDHVAIFLESEIRLHSNALQILDLQRSMTGLTESLVVPGRLLIKVGTLIKLDRKGVAQTRIFFLFNDLLIYAVGDASWSFGLGFGDVDKNSKNGLSAGGVAGGNNSIGSLRFCKKLGLYDITVVGVEDGIDTRKWGFQILTSEKSFSVHAGSFEDKQDWIDAIRDAKSDLLRDRRTLLKDGESTMKRVRRERNTSMLNSPSFPRSNTSPLVVGPQFGFIPPTPSEEIEALVLDGPLADSTLDMMEPLSLPSPIESPSLSHSSSRPSLRSRRWSDLTPSVAAKIKEELPSSASSPVGGIVAIKVIENYHAPVFVPDSKVDKCMQCFGGFGFWKRRHHCRLCGAVICYSCSTKTFIIPSDNDSVPNRLARACDTCYETVFENKDLDTEIALVVAPIEGFPIFDRSGVEVESRIGNFEGWRKGLSAREALATLLGRSRN